MKLFKLDYLSLILILLLVFLGCSKEEPNYLEDIIPNITVSAGEEKRIVFSDLFYSDVYDPVFLNIEDHPLKEYHVCSCVGDYCQQ